MKVRDAMTSDIVCIQENASLAQAATFMKNNDIGAIPVFRGETCVGMVTDRDIVVRAIAEGFEPATTPVRDAMTPNCIFCYEDEDLNEAANLMKERHIRRLVVKDDNDQVTGILSLQNIAQSSDDKHLESEVLEGVTVPEPALTA